MRESKTLRELGLEGGINEREMRIVRVVPGLFEPRAGLSDSRAMTKSVDRSEAQAELARYEWDQALGHDTVPDVLEYEDERRAPGSSFMMRWVDESGFGGQGVGRYNRYDGPMSARQLRDFMRITVMDSITDNTDRHVGNYLVDRDNDRIWAIDSGFGKCRGTSGTRALSLLSWNLPGIRGNYDQEEVRRLLADAAADVRAKLPELERITSARLGRQAAENFRTSLERLERALLPHEFPSIWSRFW